jgi:hypothetical protein
MREMENVNKVEPTYVLFGKEAVLIYKMSLNDLLSAHHINFKIGEYYDINTFIKETKKWDDFIEINEDDYNEINNGKSKSLINHSDTKKNNKFSILRLFKK